MLYLSLEDTGWPWVVLQTVVFLMDRNCPAPKMQNLPRPTVHEDTPTGFAVTL